MVTLFIMSGLPFSGKSTLSRKMSEQLGIPRISFDETWLKVEKEQSSIPGSDDIERWRYINKVCEEQAQQLLKEGKSVVYDNLGSSFDQRQRMRDLASEVNAISKVVYVNVDKETVAKKREGNLTTQERAQVSDHDFNQALENFEAPRQDEKALIYDPLEDMEKWI